MEILLTYCCLVFLHFIGDFMLQSDKDAKCKSTSFKCLISHTTTYTIPFLIGNFFYPVELVAAFVVITFIAHTITDYFTSKLNSRLWKSGNMHNYFVALGFDQALHYIQLFVTFYLLFS
jgi:phage-related holin